MKRDLRKKLLVSVLTAAMLTAGGDVPAVRASENEGGMVTEQAAVSAEPVQKEDAAAAPNKEPADKTAEPAATTEPSSYTLPLSKEDGYEAYMIFEDESWQWINNSPASQGGNGKDAVITGDGTYTVSINKDALGAESNARGLNELQVLINGMAAAEKFDASNVKVENISVSCDGKELSVNPAHVYYGNMTSGYNEDITIEIYNIFGYNLGKFFTRKTFAEDACDNNISNFTVSDSLSVTFSLSGITEGKTPKEAYCKNNIGYVRTVTGDWDSYLDIDYPESSETPLQTDEPEKTAEPSEPGKPAEPVSPAAPVTAAPADPVTTAAPEEPVSPEEPVMTVAPEEPVRPEEPAVTAAPAEPVTTAAPAEPVNPEVPAMTESPAAPVATQQPIPVRPTVAPKTFPTATAAPAEPTVSPTQSSDAEDEDDMDDEEYEEEEAEEGTDIKDKTGTTYTVTQTGKKAEVEYTAPKAGKKGTVTIPNTVTINGVDYKVTSIASNAFKGNGKVKKIVVSGNIDSIGNNAFKNCKNLKVITIKSKKLNKKSISKNAFKGISKKVVIKVPKNKKKAYKKLFQSKGLNKSIKFV